MRNKYRTLPGLYTFTLRLEKEKEAKLLRKVETIDGKTVELPTITIPKDWEEDKDLKEILANFSILAKMRLYLSL